MGKLFAVMALGGCSFVTMQTPRGSPPECTESRESPVGDLLLTAATPFVVYAAVHASDSPSDPNNQSVNLRPLLETIAVVYISAPIMALFGTSSIYGFVKAGRCTRIKSLYQQSLAP